MPDVVDAVDEADEDLFGDCFAVEPEELERDLSDFHLTCPHNKKLEQKKVFGFIHYVHQEDGKPCDLCNKFNLRSAKVSEILSEGGARSIRDDAYRANILTSPKRRKEYLTHISKLSLYEFLAEIKLLDRYVILRHGIDHTPYKIGVEVFKAFGRDFPRVLDYLFPNEEYQPQTLYRRTKYYRQFSHSTPIYPIDCLPEIEVMLFTRRDTDDAIRRAELGIPSGMQTKPVAPVTLPAPPAPIVVPTGAAPIESTHPAIQPNPYFPPHPNTLSP